MWCVHCSTYNRLVTKRAITTKESISLRPDRTLRSRPILCAWTSYTIQNTGRGDDTSESTHLTTSNTPVLLHKDPAASADYATSLRLSCQVGQQALVRLNDEVGPQALLRSIVNQLEQQALVRLSCQVGRQTLV